MPAALSPEKREERTTEGGLDAAAQHNHLAPVVRASSTPASASRCSSSPRASSSPSPRPWARQSSELHTGAYCDRHNEGDFAARDRELKRLQAAAKEGAALGLEIHAGHGLSYDNVGPVAAIPEVRELNIGHFLIGEAIFVGLEATIRRMRELMDAARKP